MYVDREYKIECKKNSNNTLGKHRKNTEEGTRNVYNVGRNRRNRKRKGKKIHKTVK